MTITRVLPEKDNSTEGYEEPFARNTDAVDVRGVYIQNDSSDDTTVLITRDVSGNMTFVDGVTSVKTLAQLAAGGGSGVPYEEFLLDNEPTASTGTNDAVYSLTRTAGKVTNETWKRDDTTNVKTIDYTYSGSHLSTEVRKVFDTDGTTILAQVTWTYTYTGASVTSAIMTRDV